MGKTNGMGLEAGAEWTFLPQVPLLLPSPPPPPVSLKAPSPPLSLLWFALPPPRVSQPLRLQGDTLLLPPQPLPTAAEPPSHGPWRVLLSEASQPAWGGRQVPCAHRMAERGARGWHCPAPSATEASALPTTDSDAQGSPAPPAGCRGQARLETKQLAVPPSASRPQSTC